MAEFQKVLAEKKRLCQANTCLTCPLSSDNNEHKMTCESYMLRHPTSAENIIMEWSAAHPAPQYPSWDDAWKQLFPDSQHPDAPCLKYMLPNNHPQMCVTSCAECSKQPIPADIAERLGIQPINA